MGQYIIEGRKRLNGSVKIQGAKNSALPILAATVAVGRPCVIHNCPDLSDIDSTVKILNYLGGDVYRNKNTHLSVKLFSLCRKSIVHQVAVFIKCFLGCSKKVPCVKGAGSAADWGIVTFL